MNHLLAALRAGALDRDSLDPDERAGVELCDWLVYPTELGHLPDTLELVDSRVLAWPPRGGEETRLWVFRWTVRDPSGLDPDQVDVGLVGSVTFSLFSCAMHERPVEDVYALHCTWELTQKKLVVKGGRRDGVLGRLLGGLRSKRTKTAEAEPLVVVSFDPVLGYPGSEVALFEAELDGRAGWRVADGVRTCFYPADELPEAAAPKQVLDLHCGRVLLGFTRPVDRRSCLGRKRAELSDADLVARFEAFLRSAKDSEAGSDDPLDWLGPAGRHLESYVEAAMRVGRRAEALELVERLAPHWDHNSGRAALGKAAFRLGEMKTAEQHIRRLIAGYPHAHRSETIDLLARILTQTNRCDEGWLLLTDAITSLMEEGRTARGIDVGLFARWRAERAACLHALFPERAQAFLDALEGG